MLSSSPLDALEGPDNTSKQVINSEFVSWEEPGMSVTMTMLLNSASDFSVYRCWLL